MSVLTDEEIETFLKGLIKTAFDAAPPNSLTPQIIQAAQGLEAEIWRRQMAVRRTAKADLLPGARRTK